MAPGCRAIAAPCPSVHIPARPAGGQVAEWSKARAWKVRRRETVSRVRIPSCPPPTLVSFPHAGNASTSPVRLGACGVASGPETHRMPRPSPGMGAGLRYPVWAVRFWRISLIVADLQGVSPVEGWFWRLPPRVREISQGVRGKSPTPWNREFPSVEQGAGPREQGRAQPATPKRRSWSDQSSGSRVRTRVSSVRSRGCVPATIAC